MKRLFDIIVSAVAIIVLSPLMLLIAFWIKVDSKGPVIFKQIRVGKNKAGFKILKFRTMVYGNDQSKQITVHGDSRITKAGNWLRKYKLDELPQLFNVIKGDMSMVGPRPEVPGYVALYNPHQQKVLTVRPGITDYASIAFSNESELLARSQDPEKEYSDVIMPAKLELNLKYINEMSMMTDLRILLLTIRKVFL